jgi:trimeric autotransporter adhesin
MKWQFFINFNYLSAIISLIIKYMKKYLLIILPLSLSFLSSVQAQIISTVVGKYFSGVHSGDGGPATNAGLDHPYGVAIDSRGNLYVSEYRYYLRKVDHNGIITTIAGNGTTPGPLGDGGPATAAYIDMVTDLAMDASDNLYIVDHGNSRIRKIDKAGIITSVVGGGLATADGVMATNAKCENPNGMTVDASGNLYIAVGSVVRKVDASTGKINTVAGNGIPGYSGDGGAAAAARLDGPYDVAINKAGELFITDQTNNTIRKVSASGIISTIAGSASLPPGYGGDGGAAVASVLYVPWGSRCKR